MIRTFRIPGQLREGLVEKGVPVSAVLRRAGLPQNLLEQARILVSTEEFFALWRAIGEVSKDPTIGLKLGSESRTERLHPVGIAALSTETLGAAIHHMARYKKLCAPEAILHEVIDQEWTIRFQWTLAVESEPPVLMEYCFAWILNLARIGTGTRMSPIRVELLQPRSHAKALERHFGCPVLCGANRNAIVFAAPAAGLPFITRNAELLDMLAPQFDIDLNQRDQLQSTLTDLVRGAIQQRLTGRRPVIDDIARDLHLSARTLQRRLREAGSSFQRLLNDARRHMARYYLRNSVLELSEAAYLLGYEDANSFARAFTGWEGVPPTSWRAAMTAQSADVRTVNPG